MQLGAETSPFEGVRVAPGLRSIILERTVQIFRSKNFASLVRFPKFTNSPGELVNPGLAVLAGLLAIGLKKWCWGGFMLMQGVLESLERFKPSDGFQLP